MLFLICTASWIYLQSLVIWLWYSNNPHKFNNCFSRQHSCPHNLDAHHFHFEKKIQVMFSKCQRRCTWQLSPDSEIVLMWPLGWFLNTHLLVWLAFHFFEDEKLDKINFWCAVGGYKWFAYRTVKEQKDFFFSLNCE